jgi:glucose-6-phosphate 1-dehydrogenase
MGLSAQEMRFCYAEAFKTTPSQAYETLLLDVMQGDATLFMRAIQVENAWAVVNPMLDVWGSVTPFDSVPLPFWSWTIDSINGLVFFGDRKR